MGILAERLSLQIQILLEFQVISITDTDFGLKTNQFCNDLANSKVGGRYFVARHLD